MDQLRLGTELNPMERFRYEHCKSGPEILIPNKQERHYSWETGYLNSLGRDRTDIGCIYQNSLGVLDSSSDM